MNSCDSSSDGEKSLGFAQILGAATSEEIQVQHQQLQNEYVHMQALVALWQECELKLAEGLNTLQERQVWFQNNLERHEEFIQQKEVEWLQKQHETKGDFAGANLCNLYVNKLPI